MPSRSRVLPSREKIVLVGRRLLAKRGHERLSLREVARGVRFAPSSLYEHFRNREDLLEAIAATSLRELRDEVLEGVSRGRGIVERLASASAAYIAFAATRPAEFNLVFSRRRSREQVEPPSESPLIPIVMEIARAVAEGECVAPDGLTPLEMAFGLWAQVHGMAVLRSNYLASTPGFDDKARQIVSASIAAWMHAATCSSSGRGSSQLAL